MSDLNRSAKKMKFIAIVVIAVAALPACGKKVQPQEKRILTSSEFPGSESVMVAARRVFPESGEIELRDFYPSADDTYDFVVVFTGREFTGGFERMYWRYLTFAKKKTDRDWSASRVFDVPDNRFGPFNGSIGWLEQNAKELKAPNQPPQTTQAAGPRV